MNTIITVLDINKKKLEIDLIKEASSIEACLKVSKCPVDTYVINTAILYDIPKKEAKKVADALIHHGLIRWEIFGNNFASMHDDDCT